MGTDIWVATFHPDRGKVRYVNQAGNQWAARLICGSDYHATTGLPLSDSRWEHESLGVLTTAVPGGFYKITRWTGVVVGEYVILPPEAGVSP